MSDFKFIPVSNEFRKDWPWFHRAKLRSGHTIIVCRKTGLEPNWTAIYQLGRSGGHRLVGISRREIFGLLRRAIARDTNPEVDQVQNRVRGFLRTHGESYTGLHGDLVDVFNYMQAGRKK